MSSGYAKRLVGKGPSPSMSLIGFCNGHRLFAPEVRKQLLQILDLRRVLVNDIGLVAMVGLLTLARLNMYPLIP